MKSALRVALIYGVFGVLWIAVSDRFLEALVKDPHSLTLLQTFKGWAFVVASTLLLYLAVGREMRIRKRAEEILGTGRELVGTYHKTLVDIAKDEGLYKNETKAAFEKITEAASRAMGVQRVSIWFYVADQAGIRCAEQFDGKQGAHSEGMVLAAADYPAYFRAMAQGDIIAAHGAHTDPRTREFSGSYLTPFGISSMLDVPIRISGKTVGVVCHEHTGPSRLWTVEEQSFVTAIAGFITSVIEAHERARNERFIQNIFESMGEGLAVVDRDYRVLTANRAFCGKAGRDRAGVIGKPCYEVAYRIQRPCFESGIDCPVQRTFVTGEPHFAVDDRAFEEGKSAVTEISSYPIRDASGAVVSAIEIYNDVSEKRKLEEQLRQAQKMEAVGQLAGGVAHDFNNILTAIIGYAHLASMKLRTDDPSRNDIEQILASTQRATTLTQSLLAFSRRQPMATRPIELNDVIMKFEKFLRRLLRADIELRTICSGEELTVMADSGQIEQALMNLVTNARDASPQGGRITIEVRAATLDGSFSEAHGYGAPGNYAQLIVSDTGIGMDEKTRARIFEPFFTTKAQGKGTGLGLSMVYGIVKKHDGFINVYSEPGRGTTFKIYLPVHRTAGPGTPAEQINDATMAGGSETILVAEDDEVLRTLNSTVLRRIGYTVIEAMDGDEAVRKFAENKERIALALLDGIMPKKSGKEVYEEISRIHPGIKVVFLSGYPEGIVDGQAIRDRGLTLILKPVSPRELGKKVREVLDRPDPSAPR